MAVFSLNCGSCYGESLKWQELVDNYRASIGFAALVYTDSVGSVDAAAEFARRSGVTVPFATVSHAALEKVGLRLMPTTAAVVGDSLVFLSEGAQATADLMSWLAGRYGSASSTFSRKE